MAQIRYDYEIYQAKPDVEQNNSDADENTCNVQDGDMNFSFHSEHRVLVAILFSILAALTVVFNGWVICRVVRKHKHRMFTRFFIVSLSIADIMVALIIMPYRIYGVLDDNRYIIGESSCDVGNSFDVMLCTVSILNLSVLSWERYIAICKSFKYNWWFNRRNLRISAIFCWCFPILISFVLILTHLHIIGLEKLNQCLLQISKTCVFITSITFHFFTSSLAFFLPAAFMVWSNANVYLEVRRQSVIHSELTRRMSTTGGKRMKKVETRVARTIFVMTGCFLFCWLPFFIIATVDPLIGHRTPGLLSFVVTWLGYANSTANPVLYLLLEGRTCIGRR